MAGCCIKERGGAVDEMGELHDFNFDNTDMGGGGWANAAVAAATALIPFQGRGYSVQLVVVVATVVLQYLMRIQLVDGSPCQGHPINKLIIMNE